jgi:hypothetical protein
MTKSRYADYPDHPLRDVPQDVLTAARLHMREIYKLGDLRCDPDMVDPIADSVILAVVELGYKIVRDFKCPAIIHAGPGHQSIWHCERTDAHGIDDEHYAKTYPEYEWTGADAFAEYWG